MQRVQSKRNYRQTSENKLPASTPAQQSHKDSRTPSWGLGRIFMAGLVVFSVVALFHEFATLPAAGSAGYGLAMLSLANVAHWIVLSIAVIHNGRRMRLLAWALSGIEAVLLTLFALVFSSPNLERAQLLFNWGQEYFYFPAILTALTIIWLLVSSPLRGSGS